MRPTTTSSCSASARGRAGVSGDPRHFPRLLASFRRYVAVFPQASPALAGGLLQAFSTGRVPGLQRGGAVAGCHHDQRAVRGGRARPAGLLEPRAVQCRRHDGHLRGPGPRQGHRAGDHGAPVRRPRGNGADLRDRIDEGDGPAVGDGDDGRRPHEIRGNTAVSRRRHRDAAAGRDLLDDRLARCAPRRGRAARRGRRLLLAAATEHHGQGRRLRRHHQERRLRLRCQPGRRLGRV